MKIRQRKHLKYTRHAQIEAWFNLPEWKMTRQLTRRFMWVLWLAVFGKEDLMHTLPPRYTTRRPVLNVTRSKKCAS